jgi:hypothetical protein
MLKKIVNLTRVRLEHFFYPESNIKFLVPKKFAMIKKQVWFYFDFHRHGLRSDYEYCAVMLIGHFIFVGTFRQ